MKTVTIKIYQDDILLHTIPTTIQVILTEDGRFMSADVIDSCVQKAKDLMGTSTYNLILEAI